MKNEMDEIDPLDVLLENEMEDEGEKAEKPKKRGARLTARDQQMLWWLAQVRMADMESVRRALESFSDREQSERLAYRWAARMKKLGLVGGETPFYGAGQILWPTNARKPRLLSQTTRHDLLVARVSADYLPEYQFVQDADESGHVYDGIVRNGAEYVGLEVELTQKSARRLDEIMHGHYGRLVRAESVSRVEYFCTPGAARAVREAVQRGVERIDPVLGDKIKVHERFDEVGQELIRAGV